MAVCLRKNVLDAPLFLFGRQKAKNFIFDRDGM